MNGRATYRARRGSLPEKRSDPCCPRFLLAAMRLRLQGAVNWAWRPADAVLRSRTLSNLFVLIPTAAAVVFIFRHEGILGVLRSAGAISAIGGFLYMLVRVGRWWRDVKPSEPKARRAKE